ncbi:MAG: D-alanyl-D-alanine carboxypeptidase family protein [Candidatus Omnitrophica bacterium]|nr:D-alanyl-D-alanine carboxypeptidase family protein [Candidatus Omnitrophota bacterium]
MKFHASIVTLYRRWYDAFVPILLMMLLLTVADGASSAMADPSLDLDRLEESGITVLESLLHDLEPLVNRRRAQGTLPLLTFGELYAPLNPAQRAFLDAVRAVAPEQLQGASRRLPAPDPREQFEKIENQPVRLPDGNPVDDQYLPKKTYQAYQKMMQAMQKNLGKRLWVESGYRSPAHQLYLFVFYLPKHNHSIRETNRFVALPRCSEHGSPARQAIDFINEQGINGEDKPKEFEALPEYAWLQKNAGRFGFHLSYPRSNSANTSFEPWHWHYEGEK